MIARPAGPRSLAGQPALSCAPRPRPRTPDRFFLLHGVRTTSCVHVVMVCAEPSRTLASKPPGPPCHAMPCHALARPMLRPRTNLRLSVGERTRLPARPMIGRKPPSVPRLLFGSRQLEARSLVLQIRPPALTGRSISTSPRPTVITPRSRSGVFRERPRHGDDAKVEAAGVGPRRPFFSPFICHLRQFTRRQQATHTADCGQQPPD